MNIELTTEQNALQQEVREYMKTVMTPELMEEMKIDDLKEGGGPEFRKQYARMGADGWIGLSWSKALGGKELSHIEQYIFTDEVIRSGFAYPFLTTEAVAPVIAANANEEVQQEVVGGVKRGEVTIAIGYSEPNAGTDLASLRTKAEPDGDDWIINGQKMWTSNAHYADYVWLAARTDPDADKKHKGLTMFLVPTSSEGFSCTPVNTLGVRTNATYYENVRIPDKYRVGDVNGGWKLITSQLNVERLSLFTHGQVDSLYQGAAQWAAQTDASSGGKRVFPDGVDAYAAGQDAFVCDANDRGQRGGRDRDEDDGPTRGVEGCGLRATGTTDCSISSSGCNGSVRDWFPAWLVRRFPPSAQASVDDDHVGNAGDRRQRR